jgi:hypothetical protein
MAREPGEVWAQQEPLPVETRSDQKGLACVLDLEVPKTR